jgi:hypothetical protein
MMMSNREQKADSASLGSTSSVMELNGLKYRIPQSISSGVSRSYKKEYSQKNEYLKNQVMIFDLNTGTNYVNPETAMLSFKFNLTQAPAGGSGEIVKWGGSLGASALFSEIRVISKNGIELDRMSDSALLSKIFVDYSATKDKQSQIEMAQGYGDSNTENKIPNGDTSFSDDLECVIPMKYICGFFRPTIAGMLIPAGLASGLRVEISLVPDIVQAIVNEIGTVPTAYVVRDPVLLLETTELNDPAQGALMAESASNGLEYTFPSYYSTKLSVLANGTIATQVNKAVSQATRLFLTLQRPIDPDNSVEVARDSLASRPITAYATYQFRVGQNYFPNLVVDNKTEKMGYAFSALKGWSEGVGVPVSFDEFISGGKSVVGASLETAERLNLSGLMLNNSSTGEIRLKVGSADVRGVLFLEFIAVCKTSLNKTSLRI